MRSGRLAFAAGVVLVPAAPGPVLSDDSGSPSVSPSGFTSLPPDQVKVLQVSSGKSSPDQIIKSYEAAGSEALEKLLDMGRVPLSEPVGRPVKGDHDIADTWRATLIRRAQAAFFGELIKSDGPSSTLLSRSSVRTWIGNETRRGRGPLSGC